MKWSTMLSGRRNGAGPVLLPFIDEVDILQSLLLANDSTWHGQRRHNVTVHGQRSSRRLGVRRHAQLGKQPFETRRGCVWASCMRGTEPEVVI
ncbi:MAG: hypothetical protein V2A73_09915 [Pseudomonadota bacterium]